MKTRIAIPFSMLGLVLSLAYCVQMSNAQTSPVGADEPVLSGSTQKLGDVVAKADAIFVGQITQLGLTIPSSSNVASYTGVHVKVLQVLRGSVGAQITVKVDVVAMRHELAPKVGGTYMFFIKEETGWKIVLKLLPATDANVTKVKGLIPAK